ncbi:hypothetical protein G3O08_08540 [Cryomorpha ignava]|uniref:Uncharacterized protein n=1 Tax=Cryomorpha ignava TaxID=101383 RepID=A0A7K3WPI1_9FLAO|nr:hypothetical protein [Cryomorpha ignava]NEN23547.1 hypothetical protein [Cryomorpha ignava]
MLHLTGSEFVLNIIRFAAAKLQRQIIDKFSKVFSTIAETSISQESINEVVTGC